MELIAAFLTLVCVWYAYKKKHITWLIGNISASFYAYIFWNEKLYADFGLQLFFILQGFYGMFSWKKRRIVSAKKTDFYFLMWMGCIGCFLLYTILQKTDASYPLIDSILSVFSLVANQCLVFKWRQSWLLWALLDAMYVGLFLHRELYYSCALYCILLFLAITAYKKWQDEKV